MKLPSFRRIFKTDYTQEFQNLVEKMAISINYGFEVLYDALNKKISLNDNIYCTVKDIEITVDINGVPKTTTAFSLDINAKIIGIVVLSANNLTNSAIYPSSGVFINFSQNNTNIIIDHITGLQADNNYRLKLVAFG